MAGMAPTSIGRPPLTSRRVVALPAGDVESSYHAHSCSKPKETLGTKYARKGALYQVPKLLRVEGPAGTIHKGRHTLVAMPSAWLSFHHLPPASAGECRLEVKRDLCVQ